MYIYFVRADSVVMVTARKIRAKGLACRLFLRLAPWLMFVVFSPDFFLEMNFLFICIHNFVRVSVSVEQN